MKKKIFFLAIITCIILLFIIFLCSRDFFKNSVDNNFSKLNITGDTTLWNDQMDIEELEPTSWKDISTFFDSNHNIIKLISYPNSQITVYGIKQTTNTGVITLQGIGIQYKETIKIFDITWGEYSELPQFAYFDFDQDEVDELGMITRSETGTNYSVTNLYMFDMNVQTNEFFVYCYDTLDWINELNQLLSYEKEEKTVMISIYDQESQRIDIATYEEEWGASLQNIKFADKGYFVFDQNHIYLYSQPMAIVEGWATSQIINAQNTQFEISYNNGFLVVH